MAKIQMCDLQIMKCIWQPPQHKSNNKYCYKLQWEGERKGKKEREEKEKRERETERNKKKEKRKKEKALWVHKRQLCTQQTKLMWNFKLTSIPFEIPNFKNNAIHISIHT